MTTPIDTTRLRAHDELRKRLTAYREAKALYESPDPYDREEARYEAMHVAGGRIGHDETLAQALLDEHGALLDEVERLRAIFTDAGQGEHDVLALVEHYQKQAIDADGRTALAYPRALQAAADVVLNADLSLFDDEASGLGWLDDIANNILELTEEQIDAFAVTSREPEEGGTR